MSGVQAMKRIPRIKFPQRHPKPQGSSPVAEQNVDLSRSVNSNPAAAEQNVDVSRLGFVFQPKAPTKTKSYRFSSDVPAPPTYSGVGGKASMLPKRAPMSEKEIEAILLGGCV